MVLRTTTPPASAPVVSSPAPTPAEVAALAPAPAPAPARTSAPRDVKVAPGVGAPLAPLSSAPPPSLGDVAALRARGHREQRDRAALTAAATQAAVDAATAHGPGEVVSGQHPLLERFGESVGMTLGVIVTEALALVPSWNAPLLDARGQPVARIEGAERIGDHDLRKRHQEVVGPKISAYVKTLPPGVVHDLLEGMGKGATVAPGASYRLEVKLADMF